MSPELLGLLPLAVLIAVVIGLTVGFRKLGIQQGISPSGLKPYGVRGWLLLFVVASAVSRTTCHEREDCRGTGARTGEPPSAAFIRRMGLLAIWLWKGVVAYRLCTQKQPSSVKQVKILLAVTPALAFLEDKASAQVFLGVAFEPESLRALGQNYLPSAVWMLYFMRSTRVRNTYFAEPAEQAANAARRRESTPSQTPAAM